MALPQAVQRMADEAEQIEKSLTGQQPAPENFSTDEPTTVTMSADENIKRLEARNKTLQGMYQADAQRYRQTLEAKERELNELRQQLSQAQHSEEDATISDEDKEIFGDDMYDFVTRAAKQAAGGTETAQLKAEVAQMRQELEFARKERQTQEAEKFYGYLDTSLPDWRKQNVDPEFLSWLNDADEFSGIRRQNILNRAMSVADAQTVVGIFQKFRSERAAQRAQNPLAKQVAPSRNLNTPSAQTGYDNRKLWTSEEIKQFYEAYRRGAIGEEEGARMEREIDQAVAEGRVRG